MADTAEVESDDNVDEDDDEISEDEAPKSTRRTNRAAAPRFAWHVLSIASATELSLEIRRRASEVLPTNLPKHRPRRNRQH